ncbi:MAG: hypothetical protein HY544_04145 [Candidatus Diapherotrites archaeon]|uniref:Uncharacterized protein n=1 Tax=Candidatus Iainarchaeum sp. TaxID=3101447 RepID=A0A8T3YNS4_9ARCH|nr:hypothetical protein [Candidatus Diapherotrites archaeon]
MSHDEQGHDNGHGEGKKGDKDKSFMVDRFLGRIGDYIAGGIAKLVAFILIIMTVGALVGYVIAQRQAPFLLVFLPATLGIIAYYERDIAVLLFVALLLFVVF